MHYLQKNILDKLRKVQSSHYAELMPTDVESGHFRYHLKELIKDGLVEQQKRGVYKLTSEGLRTVDLMSERSVAAQPMPKVITYTLLQDGDDYYFYRKLKQPYMGLLNMVSGKLHHGETSYEGSMRELQEKVSLNIPEPELFGIFEIFISNNEGLLSHVTAYCFVSAVQVDRVTNTLVKVKKENLQNTELLAPDLLSILQKMPKSNKVAHGIIRVTT